MAEIITEPVHVRTNVTSLKLLPQSMIWRGRTYQFIQTGLYHTTFDGDTLMHMFSMCTSQASFQIALNSKTLLWTLMAVEPL
jgi:hypothetical protein